MADLLRLLDVIADGHPGPRMYFAFARFLPYHQNFRKLALHAFMRAVSSAG